MWMSRFEERSARGKEAQVAKMSPDVVRNVRPPCTRRCDFKTLPFSTEMTQVNRVTTVQES
jgi:hypothetical protein